MNGTNTLRTYLTAGTAAMVGASAIAVQSISPLLTWRPVPRTRSAMVNTTSGAFQYRRLRMSAIWSKARASSAEDGIFHSPVGVFEKT